MRVSEKPHEDAQEERVSLDPLDPLTALRALLAVKPESEPEKGEDDDANTKADG